VAWRLLRRSKKGVAVSGEEQGRRVALGFQLDLLFIESDVIENPYM
jgi:hypothetical protein